MSAVTATLLFSDIEGSTALLQRIGARYGDLLLRHREIMRDAFARYGGVERGTEGDSFFVSFDEPARGVAAAVAAQRSLRDERWPDDAAIKVRIGLHVGEVIETGGGLVGLAVHHAARIAAAANGGQIVASAEVCAAADSFPVDVTVTPLGVHNLKDIGDTAFFQIGHPGIGSEFPALRARGSSQHNLPSQLTSMVGRSSELATVRQLVESRRFITLTGAGGSGKTRLALQVAASLVGRFPDGIWFVDLAAITNASEVVGAVGAAMGDRSAPDMLLSGLAGKAMLIVLDNCEHLIDECSSTAARLLAASPTLVILTTSREPLGVVGEAVFRVPSLSVPPEAATSDVALAADAVQLFIDRARLVAPDYQPIAEHIPAIAEICRRLDGIPLAIELAAARCRLFSPPEIAERLGDRFRLLTGGSRNAMPRQQTLLATVDWSYRLLSTAEQALLVRFAVFHGGAEIATCEAVCSGGEIDSADVVDLLTGLYDKSLLTAVDGTSRRFRLPETIRQYAAQRLMDADEAQQLRDAHASWFARRVDELVRSNEPRPISRLQELCRWDGDNLMAAAEWLVDHDPSVAVRFVPQLDLAAVFWHGMQWLAPLTLRALDAALAIGADADLDRGDLGIAHIEVAQAAFFGHVEVDHAAHQAEALRLIETIDDSRAAALVSTLAAFQVAQVEGVIPQGMANRGIVAADRSGVSLCRLYCRVIGTYSASPEPGLQLTEEIVAIADGMGEATVSAIYRLELAERLGFLGRGPEALQIARSVDLPAEVLVRDGSSLEAALFAAIVIAEHGDLAAGLQMGEDLHASLLARPHSALDAARTSAAVSRLRSLAGDDLGAQPLATGAVSSFANDPSTPFLGRLASVCLSAILRRQGALAAACNALASRLRTQTAGSADGWLRTLEEGAWLAHEMGDDKVAATLLATASSQRMEGLKPLSPACARELQPLLEAVSGATADAVTPDEATALVLALAG